MDNRRLILAIVISVVILFGWNAFSDYMGWTPEPAPVAENAQTGEAPAPAAPQAPAAPAMPVARFTPSEGRLVNVETPLYKAVFHTGGGILQSFELKNYDQRR